MSETWASVNGDREFKVGDIVWWLRMEPTVSVQIKKIAAIVYEKDYTVQPPVDTDKIWLYELWPGPRLSFEAPLRAHAGDLWPYVADGSGEDGRGEIVEKLRRMAQWLRNDADELSYPDGRDTYWMEDELAEEIVGMTHEEVRLREDASETLEEHLKELMSEESKYPAKETTKALIYKILADRMRLTSHATTARATTPPRCLRRSLG